MQNKFVLISGIGIAGTTLAYWLGERGFEPTLIERAPGLRTGGYVIDFWGLGYEIAERMRLAPDLTSQGYKVKELRLVDTHGQRVGGFEVGVIDRLTAGRYVTLPRGDLARMIYRKLDGRYETIFDDSIGGIEQTSEGVRVSFERAAPRRFDLVVGADGLHSRVRALAFGAQERFETYLGYAVAAFEMKGYAPRDEQVYLSHAVPGRQAARFAMRDDRTLFLLVFAADRATRVAAHDTPAVKALLHTVFDGLGWECPQIMAALDACDDVYFDEVSQIRMKSWRRGRVTLVGDAAFCPSLLAGQGAALAMIAAYVLAGELGNDRESLRGIESYQRLLWPFMTAKQKAATRFAGFFLPRTWAGIVLRNEVSRMMAIPAVAKRVFGASLLDRIDLPSYD